MFVCVREWLENRRERKRTEEARDVEKKEDKSERTKVKLHSLCMHVAINLFISVRLKLSDTEAKSWQRDKAINTA